MLGSDLKIILNFLIDEVLSPLSEDAKVSSVENTYKNIVKNAYANFQYKDNVKQDGVDDFIKYFSSLDSNVLNEISNVLIVFFTKKIKKIYNSNDYENNYILLELIISTTMLNKLNTDIKVKPENEDKLTEFNRVLIDTIDFNKPFTSSTNDKNILEESSLNKTVVSNSNAKTGRQRGRPKKPKEETKEETIEETIEERNLSKDTKQSIKPEDPLKSIKRSDQVQLPVQSQGSTTTTQTPVQPQGQSQGQSNAQVQGSTTTTQPPVQLTVQSSVPDYQLLSITVIHHAIYNIINNTMEINKKNLEDEINRLLIDNKHVFEAKYVNIDTLRENIYKLYPLNDGNSQYIADYIVNMLTNNMFTSKIDKKDIPQYKKYVKGLVYKPFLKNDPNLRYIIQIIGNIGSTFLNVENLFAELHNIKSGVKFDEKNSKPLIDLDIVLNEKELDKIKQFQAVNSAQPASPPPLPPSGAQPSSPPVSGAQSQPVSGAQPASPPPLPPSGAQSSSQPVSGGRKNTKKYKKINKKHIKTKKHIKRKKQKTHK